MKIRFHVLHCVVSVLMLLSSTANLLAQGAPITITNPTPANSDYFAFSVAALGNNRLIIGAYYDDTTTNNGGSVYLFNTNGSLLLTISNPAPAFGDHFGNAVAALGTDRILIGTHQKTINGTNSGAAYLFNTNGNLLATFISPLPVSNAQFGSAVSAVGTSRVLIGSAGISIGGAQSVGGAYLFSTNGALLMPIANPTPTEFDQFGNSVAAVGDNFFVIGAGSGFSTGPGKAFLFSTNGSLVTTFTSPTPADFASFGQSVAAVGNNRVLIGAYQDNTAATSAGIAYLFNTNGTRLTTFTNPTPAASDYFGVAVAGIGNDRVVIGASGDDTSANGAGAAYVFNTNGTLLNAFTNPLAVTFENFGNSVAGGSDWALIGAPYSNRGVSDAGAAYLYNLSASIVSPTMRTFLTTSNMIVAWPSSTSGFQLQQNTNVAGTNWSDVNNSVSVVGQENQVGVTPAGTNKFYRLFHQ